jgi:hypothetical protein
LRSNKRLLALLALALAVAALAARGAAMPMRLDDPASSVTYVLSGAPAKKQQRVRRADPRAIRRLRHETWRWQTLMGRRHTRGPIRPTTRPVLRFWQRQARIARRQAAHPPHRRAWACIHRYEASWHDGGDPYWGGLQMDRGFMSRYAPRYLLHRGWADRWRPLEQMWVAERAYRAGRGFWPWPNSARMCGVL